MSEPPSKEAVEREEHRPEDEEKLLDEAVALNEEENVQLEEEEIDKIASQRRREILEKHPSAVVKEEDPWAFVPPEEAARVVLGYALPAPKEVGAVPFPSEVREKMVEILDDIFAWIEKAGLKAPEVVELGKLREHVYFMPIEPEAPPQAIIDRRKVIERSAELALKVMTDEYTRQQEDLKKGIHPKPSEVIHAADVKEFQRRINELLKSPEYELGIALRGALPPTPIQSMFPEGYLQQVYEKLKKKPRAYADWFLHTNVKLLEPKDPEKVVVDGKTIPKELIRDAARLRCSSSLTPDKARNTVCRRGYFKVPHWYVDYLAFKSKNIDPSDPEQVRRKVEELIQHRSRDWKKRRSNWVKVAHSLLIEGHQKAWQEAEYAVSKIIQEKLGLSTVEETKKKIEETPELKKAIQDDIQKTFDKLWNVETARKLIDQPIQVGKYRYHGIPSRYFGLIQTEKFDPVETVKCEENFKKAIDQYALSTREKIPEAEAKILTHHLCKAETDIPLATASSLEVSTHGLLKRYQFLREADALKESPERFYVWEERDEEHKFIKSYEPVVDPRTREYVIDPSTGKPEYKWQWFEVKKDDEKDYPTWEPILDEKGQQITDIDENPLFKVTHPWEERTPEIDPKTGEPTGEIIKEQKIEILDGKVEKRHVREPVLPKIWRKEVPGVAPGERTNLKSLINVMNLRSFRSMDPKTGQLQDPIPISVPSEILRETQVEHQATPELLRQVCDAPSGYDCAKKISGLSQVDLKTSIGAITLGEAVKRLRQYAVTAKTKFDESEVKEAELKLLAARSKEVTAKPRAEKEALTQRERARILAPTEIIVTPKGERYIEPEEVRRIRERAKKRATETRAGIAGEYR